MLITRAYGRRLMDQLELGIAAVWHGEGFARTKRLPDLDKILRRRTASSAARDKAYTTAETKRWASLLAAQERSPS